MPKTNLTEEKELEIIEYYKKHSNYNTCKVFHIRQSRLDKLLFKHGCPKHTKQDGWAFGTSVYKQTCLETYGVANPSCLETVAQKRKQTIRERYGVDFAAQCEETQKKMKQTCLKKYGVENASQSLIIKEKKKQAYLAKYGVDSPFKAHEVKEKISTTLLEQYGVENAFAAPEIKEKIKQTHLKKYGTTNINSVPEIRQKIKQTCLKKYKVEYWNQSEQAAKFHRKRYKVNELYFDSFPEVCFYLYHIDNNINIKKCTRKFNYNFLNKEHYYFPDFEIGNQIYELKGAQFLKLNGEWQCPFDHNLDELFEAKHQCAIKNNVIILYTSDYLQYIDWFNKAGYNKNDFIV